MTQQKPAAPEPTEIAGRYQVVKKLGAGAFGTVYKAKDSILGRMVAIKTIRLEGLAAAGASLDELMDRFKREAQVSAQLKHPNIVTIYDVGDADGLSYLAMEFIDGAGLDRIIAAQGRLPVERAASIGAQVADALDFAHKHSVVHRDIKPANIMIETGDRVKVTDFGIAKVTTSGDHLTVTGSLLGTPSYMSPEQARGAELDGRSDLFAVGCVLYEMVTGKKAFRGDSITGLIFKIITEEPQPLRETAPDIPDAMVRIISRALSKAPETRYQSGRDLADDLLALTRPGSTPTLRQVETPTEATSMGALPTVAVPPTAASAPPSPAQTATVVSAPTKVAPPPPPPPAARPAPAASPRPSAAAPTPPHAGGEPRPAQAKKGSGLGILVALAVVGLLVLGLAAGAGWYFFLRKPAATVAEQGTVPTTTLPPAEGPSSSESATTGTASTPSTASDSAEVRAGTRPIPATVADAGGSGPTISSSRSEGPSTSGTMSAPSTGAASSTATSSAEHSFLDSEPEAQVDGVEAGQRLAEGYRSGPTTSFGPRARFKARARSPKDVALPERPAVATIRHVVNAQEAYRKKNGRYGNLAELASAQLLFLDVKPAATAFQRAGYRFELSLEEEGFQVTAMPTSPGPRPFVGDDSGIIRAGVE